MSRIIYPPEFEHFKEMVMDFGAKKHGPNNWLEPNGRKSSFTQMHDSAFHHLARSYAAGPVRADNRLDHEALQDHLLLAITRLQMVYTRVQRGILHKDDYDDFAHLIE